MGIKVVVNSVPKNRISINKQGRDTIRTVGIGGNVILNNITGSSTLTSLNDVDASSLDNNETLIYDEASGKFVVKMLPIINGGNF